MKTLRLRRLFRRERVIFATLDHGFTQGPIPGLVNIRQTVERLRQSEDLDALILHRGTMQRCADLLRPHPEIAAVLHLNGAESFGPYPYNKELISSVEDALCIGADAVSFHINLGNTHTPALLRDLGRVSSDCMRWGMPLLVMVVVQGGSVESDDISAQCTAARIAMEVGADAVKIQHPGSEQALAKVISGVNIPVLVAGGPFDTDEGRVLAAMHEAVNAGATGFAIGRNLFGRPEPRAMAAALAALLRQGVTTDRAMAILKEATL